MNKINFIAEFCSGSLTIDLADDLRTIQNNADQGTSSLAVLAEEVWNLLEKEGWFMDLSDELQEVAKKSCCAGFRVKLIDDPGVVEMQKDELARGILYKTGLIMAQLTV